VWDAVTGVRRVADEEEMERARKGELTDGDSREAEVKRVELWNVGLDGNVNEMNHDECT
jgi:hypothetical protein